MPRVSPIRPRIPGRRLLHSPGPTPVPDEVVHAMSRQPTDLADANVMRMIGACEHGMKRLLQTERAEVFFYSANGHGGWEAVIANLVGPGTKILVPGTGHFSDGWAEQVNAFGGSALRTPWVEGEPIDAAAVEAALKADTRHEIAAVFAVHTDTASSVTSDLAAIRAAIDAARHPALYVVDGLLPARVTLSARPDWDAENRASLQIEGRATLFPGRFAWDMADLSYRAIIHRLRFAWQHKRLAALPPSPEPPAGDAKQLLAKPAGGPGGGI